MKLIAILTLVLGTGCLSVVAAQGESKPTPGKQVAQEFAHDGRTIHYLLFLPADYKQQKKWPLLLFLHGAGERGDDLEQVKVHGPPKLVEKDADFPFVVVSPQCPAGAKWNAEALQALLGHVESELEIDPDRVSVTGLSMGGYGTWALLAADPDHFAAAVPICGGGNLADAEKMKHVPIRVYHGDKDRAVPVERSRQMVAALKKAGGNVEYTEYPGVGHNSWTRTYEQDELWKWLARQKRAPASNG